MQGGGKRLPNYHLVGENCVLVGENLFDLPDLLGGKYLSVETLCRLKFASSVLVSPLLTKVSSPRLERFTTHTTEMTQHVLEGLTKHDCNQVLFKAFTMTNFQNFLLL